MDGSASSYQAVAWAAAEAALHHCPLHIITSMAIPTGLGPGISLGEADLVELVALHAWSDTSGPDVPVRAWEEARESAEAVLAESLAGWSERYPDVPVRRIVIAARRARSLLDEAATAQSVVVGTHGRGGFASSVLGSTSNALLHSIDVPMIVVRSR
ncbi:universal stress protein [Nocardia beijingensis]|uniref:universal stress protein n=1 Tax=Nocardia beijingensis TaxID=95162 RepID=UPI002B4AEC72|nr:universal stress protein [Nocardia beijingensis]